MSRDQVGNMCTRPRGRPTDADFEIAVLQRMTSIDKWRSLFLMNAPLKAIFAAGTDIAKEEPFCNGRYVKGLKFSKCWAAGLLRRHNVTCTRPPIRPQQNKINGS